MFSGHQKCIRKITFTPKTIETLSQVFYNGATEVFILY